MIDVAGYVLAGGASSRMGTDKALLELAGKSLIEHACEKLRQFCAEVHILSSRAELGRCGHLVPDLRAECGPLAGIEAALTHSRREWNLVLPVDLPFLPGTFLRAWVERVRAAEHARLAYLRLDGRPQPALLLIRRDLLGQVSAALDRGERKLLTALNAAAIGAETYVEDLSGPEAALWFTNLNTPADLENARRTAQQNSADAS